MFQIAAGIILAIVLIAAAPLILRGFSFILGLLILLVMAGGALWIFWRVGVELNSSVEGRYALIAIGVGLFAAVIYVRAMRYGSLTEAFELWAIWLRPTFSTAGAVEKARQLSEKEILCAKLVAEKKAARARAVEKRLLDIQARLHRDIEEALKAAALSDYANIHIEDGPRGAVVIHLDGKKVGSVTPSDNQFIIEKMDGSRSSESRGSRSDSVRRMRKYVKSGIIQKVRSGSEQALRPLNSGASKN